MVKTKKIGWLLILGVYLLLFYAFMYSDIMITTSHGINFWDIILEGNIFDYYQICIADVNNAAYEIYTEPCYDFLIYIVFALWNFPVWVARRFFGVDIWQSAIAMIWAKSLILVFTLLVTNSMVKICHTLSLEAKQIRQVVLLFLTSALLSSCVFVISQYDIIYLFFMLEAFNCYLKKQLKGFTFYLAIALPFKPFSLLLFPPLILYKEKNIIKIFLHTIGVLFPWVILHIVFSSGIGGNIGNILIMFKNKIEIGNVEIPTFILAIFIFYFGCYSLNTPLVDEDYQKGGLSIAFMAYALFFVICGGNLYWYILMVPFQCLLIVVNKSTAFISAILETIASICLIGSSIWQNRWCFDVRLVRSTYIAKIFGERKDSTDNILDMIHSTMPSIYDMAVDRIDGILWGAFMSVTLVFIWINCIKVKENALKEREIPDYLFVIRMVLFIAICFVPIVPYVF